MYTPETLRSAGGEFDCPDCFCKSVPQEVLDAHADAWKDDIIRMHTAEAKVLTLEFRLEACEKGFAMDDLRKRLEAAEKMLVLTAAALQISLPAPTRRTTA